MYIRSIGIAGIILGILFKTLHWPGASIILLSGALLAVITTTLLLIQKPGPWNIRIEYPVWIFGSVVVVMTGMIFKTMHWPGANIQLLLGMTGCAVWFLIPRTRKLVDA
jgi:hypothetical protein